MTSHFLRDTEASHPLSLPCSTRPDPRAQRSRTQRATGVGAPLAPAGGEESGSTINANSNGVRCANDAAKALGPLH